MSSDPFRGYPDRVCNQDFQCLELEKHSRVGLAPACNVAGWLRLTLVNRGRANS